MESFSIGINDEETKEKGDILDDEVPPCFEMEDAPKMPCYKTKIFIILVSIISIIVIGIVSYVLMFIIFSKEKESKCDIENGYYIPDDKAKEKKCLKCDLNCKTCHGNLTHSQCEKCFSSFIPFYEYSKIKFCNKRCEDGEKYACQKCDRNKNECTSCNFGYYMPEDEERKVDCQKCAVDNCYECSGKKNSSKCKSCISSYSPIYKEYEVIKCLCEEGEKEKCMKCDLNKNECIACNEGYKLLNGKCFSYSIKAIYNVTSGFYGTQLIKAEYLRYIKTMIIDGNETKPCDYYVFTKLGNHKVFFFFDMQNLTITFEMFGFYFSNNLVEIFFTSNFKLKKLHI